MTGCIGLEYALQLSAQPKRVYFRRELGQPALLREQVVPLVQNLPEGVVSDLLNSAFQLEELAQSELFLTFLEHLVALGIVEYANEPRSHETRELSFSMLGVEYFYIQLTAFGRLFHRACVASDGLWVSE